MAKSEKKTSAGCTFTIGILINIVLIILFYMSIENRPDMGFNQIESLFHQLKDEYDTLKMEQQLPITDQPEDVQADIL